MLTLRPLIEKLATYLRRYSTLSLIILVFIGIGITVISIRAATQGISREAESGVLSNYAFTKTDSTASGGNAISFTAGMPAATAHAPLPPGPFHTPRPTITMDASLAPGYKGYMEEVLRPLLLDWYPVLGDYYAYPNYAPPTSFTVIADPNYTGVAQVEGTVIRFSTNYFKDERLASSPGAFMHEATHVIQRNQSTRGNLPGWIVEGEADYTREHIYKDRAPRVAYASETYLNGYSPGSNLLHYIQTKYSSTFIHDVNVAGAQGLYNENIFVQRTGKTIGQLWTELTGRFITSQGPITGIAGKCLDVPNYQTADGTRIKIQTCNGSSAERWVLAGINTTSKAGAIIGYGNKCLDVTSGGTADGTPVQYYSCNAGRVQQWLYQANKTLVNVNSNKCLQPVGGSSEEYTLLEIATCSGTAAQQWTLPPS
ncbi:MAG TPA: ricin-type beta-trefoil lectin domain protein [Candidatus Limnocylindrales bacterium]|nr:ricin-type beta-trefoil lectin domain protein [Candidatus Limnocylindrales bacterium]